MGLHQYKACEKCHGTGVVSKLPREERTQEIGKWFAVCPACHGLGRVRVEEPPPETKAAAAR
jgi:DnaJ-class molecular chaperone